MYYLLYCKLKKTSFIKKVHREDLFELLQLIFLFCHLAAALTDLDLKLFCWQGNEVQNVRKILHVFGILDL
jgi:hypothetical protein